MPVGRVVQSRAVRAVRLRGTPAMEAATIVPVGAMAPRPWVPPLHTVLTATTATITAVTTTTTASGSVRRTTRTDGFESGDARAGSTDRCSKELLPATEQAASPRPRAQLGSKYLSLDLFIIDCIMVQHNRCDYGLPLTEREKQLLRRLAEQKPDDQIALEIGGTVKQIVAQRERLLARLGIYSHGEIRRAARLWARWPYRQIGG